MTETKTTPMILVTGNTYPVKERLRELGGQWDARAKGWRVPAEKAAEARALVAGPPKPSAPVALVGGGAARATGKSNQKPGHCSRCGTLKKAGEGSLVFCMEDSGCLEHHDHSGYHVYCKDADKDACEAARVARREAQEAARAAAQEAARVAEAERAAARAAYAAFKAQLTAQGLEYTSAGISKVEPVGETLAAMNDYYRCRIRKAQMRGVPAAAEMYLEEASGHDDWRTYVWSIPALCHQLRLEHARSVGITVEHARTYLAKYASCDGADIYKAVLIEAGETVSA